MTSLNVDIERKEIPEESDEIEYLLHLDPNVRCFERLNLFVYAYMLMIFFVWIQPLFHHDLAVVHQGEKAANRIRSSVND